MKSYKAILILLVLLSYGCASAPYIKKTDEQILSEADIALKKKDYEEAITSWKRVRENFPSPEVSAKLTLDIADAYFADKKYLEASSEYAGFRKLYPQDPKVSYTIYKQGLSYYKQVKRADNDLVAVNNTQLLMNEYMTKYPNGEFITEVKKIHADCLDKKVQNELYVGKFYYRTGKYSAALGRFDKILPQYPDSKRKDEIYIALAKTHRKLKNKQLCYSNANLLLTEQPTSKYAKEAKSLADRCK